MFNLPATTDAIKLLQDIQNAHYRETGCTVATGILHRAIRRLEDEAHAYLTGGK